MGRYAYAREYECYDLRSNPFFLGAIFDGSAREWLLQLVGYAKYLQEKTWDSDACMFRASTRLFRGSVCLQVPATVDMVEMLLIPEVRVGYRRLRVTPRIRNLEVQLVISMPPNIRDRFSLQTSQFTSMCLERFIEGTEFMLRMETDEYKTFAAYREYERRVGPIILG